MYCENCGNRLGENHLFCEECGTRVNGVVSNNTNSNKTLWIVLSCIFGGFILFVILGIIFFSFIVINVNETIGENNSHDYVDIKEPYTYRDDVIEIEKF